MSNKEELQRKTLSGLMWSFVDLLSKQGIQFLITIVLTRLLVPEHFGLMGMITIFVALSETLVDSGFSQSLIREEKVSKIDYSTVFIFNMIFSIVIYFMIYLIAPLVSNFYNEPQINLMLRVIGIVVFLQAVSIVPKTILTREVNFKAQARVSVISSFVSGFIAIIMAYHGFGVWSLVFRVIIQKMIESIFLVYINRWIPSFVFSINSFRKFFSFGWKLLLSSLINTFYNNLYYVIIGRMYTTKDLGFYTNAGQIRDTVNHGITQSIQRVTYPILSSIQTEKEKLKASFKKLIRMTAYVFFPMMIGLASIADSLIVLLLGDQWEPAILFFQLLCIAGILYPMHAINLNILKVKGRSDLFLTLEIIKKLLTTVALLITIFLDLGISSFIITAIITTHLGLFVNTYYSGKEIGYGSLEQIKDLLPAYLLSFFMGAVVILFGNIFELNIVLTIIIQIILGVSVYIGSSVLFKVPEFKEMQKILKLRS